MSREDVWTRLCFGEENGGKCHSFAKKKSKERTELRPKNSKNSQNPTQRTITVTFISWICWGTDKWWRDLYIDLFWMNNNNKKQLLESASEWSEELWRSRRVSSSVILARWITHGSFGLDIMLLWNAFWNCLGGKEPGVCDSRTEQQSRAVLILA